MPENPTLAHYEDHAARYDASFADHDTSDAISRLLTALERVSVDRKHAPAFGFPQSPALHPQLGFRRMGGAAAVAAGAVSGPPKTAPALPAPSVLELGCGNGRDLAALQQAGAVAEGVEGAAGLAAIAAQRTGLPIHQFDLLSPRPPPWQGRQFQAIYAHHVLFHIPSPALPFLLWRARDWLVPDGLFYFCDATGDGLEGTMPDGRHIALRRPQSLHRLMREAGFVLVEEWRRPLSAPRRQQGWLAGIWQKTDA